jgi:selenocysteine-specific elongation factor
MFVIGTAGHIDHGKSSMITRLTGIDPDRLPEEKERGMTIDIGFAHYDTPDGKRIGIIDVPGHERFVRNMIAGAGGIDAVILVVAADDGWMPQSQEHLQITELLGIKYGVVVISKIDLVEKGWVDLVEGDIRDKLERTSLKDAPIVRLSSSTGEGFDRLKEEINNLAETVIVRENIGKPRLYIDRSFILPGLGGVVAGTLKGGTLEAGREISVFPSKARGRIRTIQSHNRQLKAVRPGQRTALTLTGIDKEFLSRGGVVTLPEIVDDYPDEMVLALSVKTLPESPVNLESRRRVLMILGTTEIEGELRPRDGIITPGRQGIAYYKPFEPLLAFVGDRFIVRLPTPQVTIGGGMVLDILPHFPRKRDMGKYLYLEKRINIDVKTLVITELAKTMFVDIEKDFIWSNYSQENIAETVDQLRLQAELDEYNRQIYDVRQVSNMIDGILAEMKGYLDKHSHLDGFPVDVIASRTKRSADSLETILGLMCHKGLLIKKGNRFDLPGRTVTVKGELKEAAKLIEGKLIRGGFSPPTIKELLGDDKIHREAFDYLVVSEKIVKAGTGLAFHSETWREILKYIYEMLNSGEILTVSALREKLGSSRKFVVPILEETDRLKITRREGDVRIKGDKFEKK